MKQKSFKKSQNGRTLFEILCVLIVIGLLATLGISDFRLAVGKNDANTIYEDVLTQADHMQHKTGATGKSIFDSAVGNKTRSGFQMFSLQEGVTFSIVVLDIPKTDCDALSGKNWSQRNIARIKINEKEYAPDAVECENINTNFKLTVVFWSNLASEADKSNETILPRLCNKGCLECQTCENNVCKDNCVEGTCMVTEDYPDGECFIPEEEPEEE
jgi:prepilin-type N-terminal cleavage/methylation domain-containing protein